MTDHTNRVYVKNETKLLWPIGLVAICDATRQDNDFTDRTGAVMQKMILNYHDQIDRVSTMTKTR